MRQSNSAFSDRSPRGAGSPPTDTHLQSACWKLPVCSYIQSRVQMPAGILIEPNGHEYVILALVALVTGSIILCCIITCVLPDELAVLMGKKEKSMPDRKLSKASGGEAAKTK